MAGVCVQEGQGKERVGMTKMCYMHIKKFPLLCKINIW